MLYIFFVFAALNSIINNSAYGAHNTSNYKNRKISSVRIQNKKRKQPEPMRRFARIKSPDTQRNETIAGAKTLVQLANLQNPINNTVTPPEDFTTLSEDFKEVAMAVRASNYLSQLKHDSDNPSLKQRPSAGTPPLRVSIDNTRAKSFHELLEYNIEALEDRVKPMQQQLNQVIQQTALTFEQMAEQPKTSTPQDTNTEAPQGAFSNEQTIKAGNAALILARMDDEPTPQAPFLCEVYYVHTLVGSGFGIVAPRTSTRPLTISGSPASLATSQDTESNETDQRILAKKASERLAQIRQLKKNKSPIYPTLIIQK